jgi:hypothetical protein
MSIHKCCHLVNFLIRCIDVCIVYVVDNCIALFYIEMYVLVLCTVDSYWVIVKACLYETLFSYNTFQQESGLILCRMMSARQEIMFRVNRPLCSLLAEQREFSGPLRHCSSFLHFNSFL